MFYERNGGKEMNLKYVDSVGRSISYCSEEGTYMYMYFLHVYYCVNVSFVYCTHMDILCIYTDSLYVSMRS